MKLRRGEATELSQNVGMNEGPDKCKDIRQQIMNRQKGRKENE